MNDDGDYMHEAVRRGEAKPGDVFQIAPEHGRDGWVGAFVVATEIKPWGIQGFVHQIVTHTEHGRAFIRLKWDEIEYVGKAVFMPADEVPAEAAATERGAGQ
jgi:hypothetical protein